MDYEFLKHQIEEVNRLKTVTEDAVSWAAAMSDIDAAVREKALLASGVGPKILGAMPQKDLVYALDKSFASAASLDLGVVSAPQKINFAAELQRKNLSAIESIQPHGDWLRAFESHSQSMALLTAQASIALSPHWQDSIAACQGFSKETSAAELALKLHYTTVAESAFLAQERLFRVPWESLGSGTQIDAREFSKIRDTSTTLTETYRTLMQSFDEREHFMASFPPIISLGPPLEILTSARVLDVLSRGRREDEHLEADHQIDSDRENEIEASVDELLVALNSEFRSVWLGAKEALRSGNPDRGRHVVVSLRELVAYVLHALAPDDKVRGWTTDPAHFSEGRPTRDARVLFVCRGINHGPFERFINADVRASIEFIRLFQRGTHELSIAFSQDQLRALVIHAGSLLRFLILTSRTIDRGLVNQECGQPVIDLDKRLAAGKDFEQHLQSDPVARSILSREETATRELDTQALEQILIGHMMAVCGEANQIFRPVTMFDYGIDGEVEFKDDDGKASGKRIYVQLKSGNSYLRARQHDGREIFDVKNERHLDYWINQPVDVYLVIRQTDERSGEGTIRWMNVTRYLENRKDKASRQIIFEGERLDMQAVWKLRDRFCPPRRGTVG